jgi:hypothetical protein
MLAERNVLGFIYRWNRGSKGQGKKKAPHPAG